MKEKYSQFLSKSQSCLFEIKRTYSTHLQVNSLIHSQHFQFSSPRIIPFLVHHNQGPIKLQHSSLFA